jgi:hypothetical protein
MTYKAIVKEVIDARGGDGALKVALSDVFNPNAVRFVNQECPPEKEQYFRELFTKFDNAVVARDRKTMDELSSEIALIIWSPSKAIKV